MLFNYEYKFAEAKGRKIFVPTIDSRTFGEKLHRQILSRWPPPDYFYHFRDGGHVAAAKAHLASHLFLRLDLKAFYDAITRTKVHRALRSIGFSQKESWHIACQSTVSKDDGGQRFSLPFGFVQSPVLATLVLSGSALGKAVSHLNANAVRLSVYMDDILLSADDEAPLIVAKHALTLAAETSRFQFNALKTFGPAPAVEVFNIDLAHNSLSISPARMTEFEAAIKAGDPLTVEGILSYVGTVNASQRLALSLL